MPIDPLTIGMQAGAEVLGTGLGMLTAKWNDRRQLEQQRKLNDLQIEAQSRMGAINQALAMDMWEKTNYSEQVKQLEKAGLNVGLMYKSAGEGGRTQAPSGSVAGGTAPSGGGELGMGMQLGLQNLLMKAQIDNINADTKNKEANTSATSGVYTRLAEGQLNKIIAETTNTELKNKLTEIETSIAEIELSNKEYRIKAEVANVIEQTNKLKLENSITTETFDAIVAETKGRVLSQTLNQELTKANIKLTETERQAIITTLVQRWTRIGMENRGLDQKDRELDIREVEQQFKTSHPGVSQVSGRIVDAAYNALQWITEGFKGTPSDYRNK